MTTCSSVIAGKNPRPEETGGLQSIEPQSRTRLSMHITPIVSSSLPDTRTEMVLNVI